MNRHIAVSGPSAVRALVAGAVYFALVFALGFALGTLRTLFVPDLPGSRRLLGVLIELPIMLAAAWVACRFVISRLAVAPELLARLSMGAAAFLLLIVAETLVGVVLFDRTLAAHFALYSDASYALGLAAQTLFALMPFLQMLFGEMPK